ncbi:MAG: hypothetical protein PUF97_01990 [Bifidobacteriaceae bacterium]|nr:hypothetical protein [Bifidobacteriaceae bacterium]
MKNNRENASESTDIAMGVVNICVLLGALVAVFSAENWAYTALVCVLMLIQVGVLGFRIAKNHEKDREKDGEK